MKKVGVSFFIVTAILFLSSSFFISCKDDESVPNQLIVIERGTGEISKVNTTTGELTLIDQVTFDGVGLTEARGLVYHKGEKKIYITSSDDGSGKLYSVDPSTMIATEINNNANDYWYGLPAIRVMSNGKLISTAWLKSSNPGGGGPGLIQFNTDGSVASTHLFDDGTDPAGVDMCCSFAVEFGDSKNELLITSNDNDLELYSSDLSGNVTLNGAITIEGFDPTYEGSDYMIRHMVKMSGKIYALAVGNRYLGSDYRYTYLAELDLATNTLTKIALLSDSEDVQYQGLASVPSDIF